MFESIYFWAAFGVFLAVLLKAWSLSSATPAGTSFWQAFVDWASITWLYFLIGLCGIFVTLNFSFLGMSPPETPEDAFMRGMAIFVIAEMLRQIKNPIQVETTSTHNLKLKK